MGTVRVYASDSLTADVEAKISGRSRHYSLKKNFRRAATDQAYTLYSFTYSQSRIPAVAQARGVWIYFDLDAIPELQAKAVTRIIGPFLYLRQKKGDFFTDPNTPVSFWGCAFEDVFLNFLICPPTHPEKKNYLGIQQTGKYFNVHVDQEDFIELQHGVQRSEITTCINAYPAIGGRRYEGRVQAVFDSATGEYPPYILVEYQDSALEIAGCSPQSGFVNEKQAVRLQWSLVPCSKNAVGRATQKSATVQWRQKGAASVQSISVNSPATSCVVPANTFPNGAIEWRVCASSIDNISAPWSDWYELTTVDNQVAAPDALSPDGDLLDGASPIALSWHHNSPLGTPPSAFEVQVNLGTGYGWRDLSGKVAGSESSYLVPANILPSGYISWRVRDYNSDGLVSPWSEPVSIAVRAAPRIPSFRTLQTDSARPLIRWFSSEQTAFQMEALSGGEPFYRSGTVFSPEASLRIPELLPNGSYTLRLRVQNQYGLWSPWAETILAIQVPRRWSITLEGQEMEAGAQLSFHAQAK